MKLQVGREVKLMSLGFLLIFFGFNGVQQYITTFFSEAGLAEIGFNSLILIYLFFILSDLPSAVLVSKYGAKKCMLASSLFYSLFIALLLSGSAPLIYLGSCILGVAASLLWTGQNSYLIRASGRKSYGSGSGFFSTFQSLGSALGVLALGLLIPVLLFGPSFLLFSVFPLLGFLALLGLKDLRPEGRVSRLRLAGKSLASRTALMLSSLWFATNFAFGLVIGTIPMQIRDTLGIGYIGILSSLFFILPVLLSFLFGRASDIKGRRGMIVFSYALLLGGLASLAFSSQPLFLIMGIGLLALNWAVIKPVTLALVGDVSTEKNLEFLTALFWMVQNMGVVSALVLSQAFRLEAAVLYSVSALAALASLLVLLPVLRMRTERIRERISREMEN